MTNEEKKTDKRVVKTKKTIKDAFISLLAKKNINDISITDVATLANVDRKTVYAYYSGVYAIREEIEAECVGSLSVALDELGTETTFGNPYPIFEKVTEVLNRNFDFYSRLVKVDAQLNLIRGIMNVIEVKLKNVLTRTAIKDMHETELISKYVTAGIVAVYQSWFNSAREQSLEDFSDKMGKLVVSGISGFIS